MKFLEEYAVSHQISLWESLKENAETEMFKKPGLTNILN